MKSRITHYGCIDVYFNVAAGRSKDKCNYFIYC